MNIFATGQLAKFEESHCYNLSQYLTFLFKGKIFREMSTFMITAQQK